MPNNNDHIKMYEPLKCSNILISLNNVIMNIKRLNLCNISNSNLNKICNYFDVNNEIEINELTKIVIILINDLYSSSKNLTLFNSHDINNNLFNNTVKTMKTLKIIGNDGIFYHLKKHELLKYINGIIALISIRINCKDKYIDTKSLIIIYYSLACIFLMNRKPKNTKNVKDLIDSNILPKFDKKEIKQCCLNYC